MNFMYWIYRQNIQAFSQCTLLKQNCSLKRTENQSEVLYMLRNRNRACLRARRPIREVNNPLPLRKLSEIVGKQLHNLLKSV